MFGIELIWDQKMNHCISPWIYYCNTLNDFQLGLLRAKPNQATAIVCEIGLFLVLQQQTQPIMTQD